MEPALALFNILKSWQENAESKKKYSAFESRNFVKGGELEFWKEQEKVLGLVIAIRKQVEWLELNFPSERYYLPMKRTLPFIYEAVFSVNLSWKEIARSPTSYILRKEHYDILESFAGISMNYFKTVPNTKKDSIFENLKALENEFSDFKEDANVPLSEKESYNILFHDLKEEIQENFFTKQDFVRMGTQLNSIENIVAAYYTDKPEEKKRSIKEILLNIRNEIFDNTGFVSSLLSLGQVFNQ